MATTLRFIFYSFMLSMAVLVCFYPEQFLWHNVGFMIVHDTEMPKQNVFALVSSFFQGGVQLYDRYDGFNIAFHQVSSGVFTLSNILTAMAYILASPFLSDSAQGFHVVFSVFFYAINTLLRTVGGYLLLRKFTDNAAVIAIGLVLMNVFLSSHFMNNGMLVNNLYGYFPLLMYCILNVFEKARLKDVILIALLIAIIVANSPLLSLGYFYQVVHFILLGCVMVYVVCSPKQWWLKISSKWRKGISFKNWISLAMLAVVCLFILMPNLILKNSAENDFYLHASGAGETQGRLNQAKSADGYFQMPNRGYANPQEFFSAMVNYSMCQWPWTWLFLGAGVVFFSLIGFVLGQNKVKYVVLIATILIVMVNMPAKPNEWWSFAHWVNVLTNPFHFLMRSLHMPALLWPYTVLPLLALGLQGCWNLVVRPESYSPLRRGILLLVLLAAGIGLTLILPASLRVYPLATSGLFILFLGAVHIGKDIRFRQIAAAILFILLLAADGAAYYVYANWGKSPDRVFMPPRIFNTIVNEKPLIIEYQNPEILPFNFFTRNNPEPLKPLANSFQNFYGLFYHYPTLLERYSRPLSLYEPRPILYKEMHRDLAALTYLYQQPRVLSSTQEEDRYEQRSFPLDITKARIHQRRDWVEYRIRLPKDFSAYQATNVFTLDARLLELAWGANAFIPAQGELTAPGMFDVHNIKKGWLHFSWPIGQELPSDPLILNARKPAAVKDIWKNTQDVLGLTYEAQHKSVLTILFPYEPKWKAWVDGKEVQVLKSQGAFLGIELEPGEHNVLLKYWPDTPVRFLILISILLITVGWMYIIYCGIKENPLPS